MLSVRQLESLKSNTKTYSKLNLVNEIFKPNDNGISRWVTRDELIGTGLELSSNGNTRHGVIFGVNNYLWDIKRRNDKKNGKIQQIRTIGISSDKSTIRPIRNDIREYFKGKCCVVCATNDIVIDHKNDLYNDHRVLNSQTQTVEDFQPLCNACNLKKRTICLKSIKEKKRYGATNMPQFKVFGIDFIEGNETLDMSDPDAMKGTYWYDPIEFTKYIFSSLNKN